MRALDIDENASDGAHEVVLCARGVAYALRDGTRLLDDVDITLRPGEAVALIGPSGAGKTTLLATLAARAGSRLVAGAVTANGRRYGAGGFAAFGTVAPQDDVLLQNLTPREALRFAATLRGADPTRVDALLVDTGLMERADVRARSLSGGQRKRLSLGLELIHSPAVLLADEPTSGLDSVAAAATTQLLLEHSAEMTVAAVVHQPSIAVFLKFARVAVLAGGRLCYDGATADVAAFFGAPDAPAGLVYANPAELAIEAVVDGAAAAAWAARAKPGAPAEGRALPKRPRVRRVVVLRALVARAALQVFRSQGLFQVFSACASSLFFGVTFFRMSNAQRQADIRLSAVFMAVVLNGLVPGTLQSCFVPLERPTMRREYLNGVWRLSDFLAARVLVASLMQVASATCFALIFHHMARLRGRLGVFGGAMILSGLLMQQIGLLLGAVMGDILKALPIYIPINLIGLVYSGFFFTNHNLTKHVQKVGYPLWYQSVYRYSLTIVVVNEFRRGRFDSCDPAADFCPLSAFDDGRDRVRRRVLLTGYLDIDLADVDAYYVWVQVGYILFFVAAARVAIERLALRP